MENITKSCAGVDVSKKHLDVYIYPAKKSFRCENNEEGIKSLTRFLEKYSVGLVTCESSGGYEHRMLVMVKLFGCKVWRVEPNRIKSFIRSEGKKVKTDSIDAKMIALFALQKETPSDELLDNQLLKGELTRLVSRRQDLVKMIIMENNRLKQPIETYPEDIRKHIEFMETQVASIDQKIEHIVDNDDNLKKKSEIIQSVPGFGKKISAVLLAQLPELGKVKNREISALIGVAPYTKQSGQYKGKSKISGGRKQPRRALFMAALVASRFNPHLKLFYDRLRKVGKPAKVALVAVMRKLIVILNVLIKKEVKWCMDF